MRKSQPGARTLWLVYGGAFGSFGSAMPESRPSPRKEASNLWKLLSAPDKATVDQGMQIAESMGAPMAAWLEGVAVNDRTGELIRNARFSGTQDAQPRLDRVLLHQLSLAEAGSALGTLRAQVRKIVLSGEEIPVLRGFDGLETLEITLVAPQNLPQSPALDDLSALGPLPSLQILNIEAPEIGRTRRELKSLAGLHAPALREANLGGLALQDIEPLRVCTQLKRVNLAKNPALRSISALAGSAGTLEQLDLSDCASIESLAPLQGARQLQSLNLEGCRGIDSLLPLADSRALTDIAFSGLTQLTSLAGLTGPFLTTQNVILGEKHWVLSNCGALTSLQGLPPLDPQITQVTFIGLDALKDLTGLTGADSVTELNLNTQALENLDALRTFGALQQLGISGAPALTDLEPLGELAGLDTLELSGCSTLTRLPTRWRGPLRSLRLADCDALRSLGQLPGSLRRLTVSGCRALTTLDGLQEVSELKLSLHSRLVDAQAKATYVSDVSALAAIPQLQVNFEPENERYNQPDERTTVFPPELARALARIPALSLSVGDGHHQGFSTSLRDLSAIGQMSSLKSLDLSACKYVSDLRWVIPLPELNHLQLWPGSDAAKLAGASTHASLDHVRKLQARLCRKYEIALPPHLAPAAKSTAKPAARSSAAKPPKDAAALKKLLKGEVENLLQALEIIRSLDDAATMEAVVPDLSKAFGRFLSSGEPAQVSSALQALTSLQLPEVFDALAAGVNTELAYSGDSEAMGKIFRQVKQPDREIARWALTWLLALAPPQASVAVDVRSRLQRIDLVQVAGLGHMPAPSLVGFTSLQEVRLKGVGITDLGCLSGLNRITALKLSGCHALTSLKGLEGCTGLKALTLSDCPQLTDLSALSAMTELSLSPGDTYGSHSVRLDPGAGLSDLRFVTGLKGVHHLELRLSATADTTPFLQCPWITQVELTLESWDIDLSSFRHCSSLQLNGLDESGSHRWAYELPALTTLEVRGGRHQFDALQATQLENVRLFWTSTATLRGLSGCRDLSARRATLESLDGLGPVQVLQLWDCTVGDFSGVASAAVTALDLTDCTCGAGLAAVGRIATLRTLKFNVQTVGAALQQLPPCPQIQSLEIPGYTGSLAFLAGWTALEVLDLRNSGELTDLDALTGLTALQKIRIRGATIKRDAWPASLKDSLDTR